MIWPFKRKARLDLPELTPGVLRYPFEAPVLHLGADSVFVYRQLGDQGEGGTELAMHLGTCREYDGDAPFVGEQVYTADGQVRTIIGAVPVARGPRSPFGQPMVHAQLEYSQSELADLDELKGRLAALIESDPDDLWNQVVSHDELVGLVQSARTFPELFDVMADMGGAGDRQPSCP